MKRLLIAIAACVLLLSLTVVNQAYAAVLPWMSTVHIADASPTLDKDLMTQLETEILPQLETIFTANQREQFKTAITNGTSFRKAFKSLMLTPEQKTQLKALLKSVSKKDAFASLTPEQKQQLFQKKKEMMMPTSAEITDKISAGMKGKGAAIPESVKQKIDAAMKQKEAFMPTSDSMTDKIKSALNLNKPE